MLYKREEAFRYTLGEPISALFSINKINSEAVETSEGKAKIIDISPEGLRINSELNIPETDTHTIELSISFELNGIDLLMDGVIVWKKEMGATTDYGIALLTDESDTNNIVKQLKIYSRKHGDCSSASENKLGSKTTPPRFQVKEEGM